MPEEMKVTILESVRHRLRDASRILAMADIDNQAAVHIRALLSITDLAVQDCMPDAVPN